jgi:hypothetical protein
MLNCVGSMLCNSVVSGACVVYTCLHLHGPSRVNFQVVSQVLLRTRQMADTDATQTALNGSIDPVIDDGEEEESKVLGSSSSYITRKTEALDTLTGNSAHETTCGGNGTGGQKAA